MKRLTMDLIRLFQELKPTKGAEIGVWEGENSNHLLTHFPNLYLYLIDNYPIDGGWAAYESKDIPLKAKQKAEKVLNAHKQRITWLFLDSGEAAKHIPDGSLDFVFIDGKHTYDFVKADIKNYLPKVRKGGLVSGHDYAAKFPGVVQAVDEAFNKQAEISKINSRVWWIWK